jgi:hypothetical protein
MTILLGNFEPPLERGPRRLSFRFLLSNLPNPFPAATPLHFGDIAYAAGLSDPVAAVAFCAPTGAPHTVVGGRRIVQDGEIVTFRHGSRRPRAQSQCRAASVGFIAVAERPAPLDRNSR